MASTRLLVNDVKTKTMCRIPLNKLSEERYAQIICYPKYESREFTKRLCEMRRLGVKALCFIGDKKIGDVPVLGKGYVGIVVSAYTEKGMAALKIRRTDANRETMKHEAEMLQIANSVNVGPRLLGFTRNLLLMELIKGSHLPVWIEKIRREKNAKKRIRRALRDILEQCRRLDETGLDHGELSRASKHIIVDLEGKAWILDFETASTMRRVANVTSICQFLFLKGKTAELISEIIGRTPQNILLSLLKNYKRSPTRGNFERILETCGLAALNY